MEDYDAYFKHAKLLTEVHSKPREKEKPKEVNSSSISLIIFIFFL